MRTENGRKKAQKNAKNIFAFLTLRFFAPFCGHCSSSILHAFFPYGQRDNALSRIV
mgnify:CR=1 FL=1